MNKEIIENVKKFIIEGHAENDINEFLAAEEMSAAQVAKIIRAAWDGIIEDADVPNSEKKAWCIEALRDLYRKMLSTGDYAGAKSAIKEIIALSDLKKAKIEDEVPKIKTKIKTEGGNVTWPKFKT